MIKVTNVLILLLLTFWTSVHGQELSHKVMVPASGVSTSGAINYSHTIGETAVEMISGSGFTLTQGFQQPAMKYTTENPHEGTGVEVYPNPATDYIKVKLFGDAAKKFTIEIITFTGTIVSSVTLEFITKYYYIQEIDITHLKLGFYFVRISSDDSKISRIFKIEKM
jgi:hypothetical protein